MMGDRFSKIPDARRTVQTPAQNLQFAAVPGGTGDEQVVAELGQLGTVGLPEKDAIVGPGDDTGTVGIEGGTLNPVDMGQRDQEFAGVRIRDLDGIVGRPGEDTRNSSALKAAPSTKVR